MGEVAVAVGNPLGTLSNTVTDGIVSALNRQVTVQNNDMTLIQTDASISPGNSGGGLFNANGELIGIVNAKSSYSEAEGIGFAIPINTAMEIGRQLIENGSVARPALGVKIMDVTDAQTAQQLGCLHNGRLRCRSHKGQRCRRRRVYRRVTACWPSMTPPSVIPPP